MTAFFAYIENKFVTFLLKSCYNLYMQGQEFIFNPFGFGLIIILSIPNLLKVFSDIKANDGKIKLSAIEIIDLICLFICLVFVCISIKGQIHSFHSNILYLIFVNIIGLLIVAYNILWMLYFINKNTIIYFIVSEILPAIFLTTSIGLRYIPLFCSGLLFAVTTTLTMIYKIRISKKNEN